MTEEQLRSAYRELAYMLGWRMRYHTRYSIRSDPGWPDDVLCKPPRIIFVEAKSEKGKVTPKQAAWLDTLSDCGLECYVWRPVHWHDGYIERVLRGRDGYIEQVLRGRVEQFSNWIRVPKEDKA